MKRNLIYYCYLNLENIPSYIFYHLYLLKKYKDVFTGHQIIYIATDTEIENEENYKQMFGFFPDAIFKFVKNHPENRESQYFLEQLSLSKELAGPDDITFYAHSKGSTYENRDEVLKWVTGMYFFNLEPGYVKIAEGCFSAGKIFAGTFKVEIPCPPWVCSEWHYAGTFYWINNKELFKNPSWNIFSEGRFSVEEYPGRQAHMEKGGVTELLFSTRTESKIHYPYDLWDLRYSGYWGEFFTHGSPILSNSTIDKFNDVIKNFNL